MFYSAENSFPNVVVNIFLKYGMVNNTVNITMCANLQNGMTLYNFMFC